MSPTCWHFRPCLNQLPKQALPAYRPNGGIFRARPCMASRPGWQRWLRLQGCGQRTAGSASISAVKSSYTRSNPLKTNRDQTRSNQIKPLSFSWRLASRRAMDQLAPQSLRCARQRDLPKQTVARAEPLVPTHFRRRLPAHSKVAPPVERSIVFFRGAGRKSIS
jgi:hypothetical protein